MTKVLLKKRGILLNLENKRLTEERSIVPLRFVLILAICVLFAHQAIGQNYITEWTFDEPATEIAFNAETDGDVAYTWSAAPSGNSGSGSFDPWSADEVVLSDLDIDAGDVVTVEMAPENLQRFFMTFDSDNDRLTDVVQWGAVAWTSMDRTLWGCENMTITADDAPNLSDVTDMSSMFGNASSFNADIGHWDVSNVTVMDGLFFYAESFNRDLGDWDVSAVTTMEGMFYNAFDFNGDIADWNTGNVVEMSDLFFGAESFNRDIGGWDVSGVQDMSSMFQGALVFNQDISGWDVSSLTDMDRIFREAEAFDQNIGIWDVSGVTDMRYAFNDAISFSHDLGEWNVSSVEDMEGMFNNADAFNQDIGGWDVSAVTSMEDMFGNNDVFNQDIGGWDVSNVENTRDMFGDATAFNQAIGDWDVSSVTDMRSMFEEAIVFNQDISGWDVSNVTEMNDMFAATEAFNQNLEDWDVSNVEGMWDMFNEALAFNQNIGSWTLHPNVNLTRALKQSGLDCDNYSATLVGWHENNPDVTERTLGAEEMQFGTIAADARESLIEERGWSIAGDSPSGGVCDGTLSVDFTSTSDLGISIYPNPTRDKVTVSGAPSDIVTIAVIDSQGREVTSKLGIHILSAGEKEIDLSGLAAGFYVVRTATASSIVIKK